MSCVICNETRQEMKRLRDVNTRRVQKLAGILGVSPDWPSIEKGIAALLRGETEGFADER